MRKVINTHFKVSFKKPKLIIINAYFIFEFFNLFAKRQVGTIVPVFEVIPRFGIHFDRSSQFFGIVIGWLNFSFDIHIYFWEMISLKKHSS